MEGYTATRAGEPALAELLGDPVLHAVLRRDGLSLGELEAAIAVARARLAGTGCERI